MNENKKSIEVVAAVITNKNSEVLFAQRSDKDPYLPNLWEFPGGKVIKGETHPEALIREIKEEMSLNIHVIKHFESVKYEYPFAKVHLHAYLCYCKTHLNRPFKEHQQILWLEKEKAQDLNFAPADIPIYKKLLITSWP